MVIGRHLFERAVRLYRESSPRPTFRWLGEQLHGEVVARLPVPLSDRRPALRDSGAALPDPAAALVRAVSGAPLAAPVIAALVVGVTAAAVVSGVAAASR